MRFSGDRALGWSAARDYQFTFGSVSLARRASFRSSPTCVATRIVSAWPRRLARRIGRRFTDLRVQRCRPCSRRLCIACCLRWQVWARSPLRGITTECCRILLSVLVLTASACQMIEDTSVTNTWRSFPRPLPEAKQSPAGGATSTAHLCERRHRQIGVNQHHGQTRSRLCARLHI